MSKIHPSDHLEILFLEVGPGKNNEKNLREYIEYLIHRAPDIFSKELENFIRYLKNESDTRKKRICAYRYNLICSSLLEKYNLHKHKFILDELSISILDNAVYTTIHQQMVNYIQSEKYVIHGFFREVKGILRGFAPNCTVTGRRKSILSVYGKILAKQDLKISSIRDIFAFRIIIDDEDPDTCFELMRYLGTHYEIDIERYKDYISIPKINGYQSLHLGLKFRMKGGKSFPLELQIRTRKMHEVAEHGIAAHHIYAKKKYTHSYIDIHPLSRPTVGEDMIYCFSPDKDMILLKKHRSLNDFARAIHTKKVLSLSGAYVNGIYRDRDHILENADTVQLI